MIETVIGFAAGYFVGTQQGRDGLRKARESVDAIRKSEEVKFLVATAMTVAKDGVSTVVSGGAGPVVAGLADAASRKVDELLGDPDEKRVA